MLPIEPEDEWRVTHVIPDGYFIQSKAYIKRLCETFVNSQHRRKWRGSFCKDPDILLDTVSYDLAISIRKDGTILDGWQMLATQLGENWFWHEIDYAGSYWSKEQIFMPVTTTRPDKLDSEYRE